MTDTRWVSSSQVLDTLESLHYAAYYTDDETLALARSMEAAQKTVRECMNALYEAHEAGRELLKEHARRKAEAEREVQDLKRAAREAQGLRCMVHLSRTGDDTAYIETCPECAYDWAKYVLENDIEIKYPVVLAHSPSSLLMALGKEA